MQKKGLSMKGPGLIVALLAIAFASISVTGFEPVRVQIDDRRTFAWESEIKAAGKRVQQSDGSPFFKSAENILSTMQRIPGLVGIQFDGISGGSTPKMRALFPSVDLSMKTVQNQATVETESIAVATTRTKDSLPEVLQPVIIAKNMEQAFDQTDPTKMQQVQAQMFSMSF
ncbi:MAG: hypothetical protein MUD10_04870, partial [Candidatus Pacebacteria bacterium]|nr:hypothetical protein [Candidatus Paceibacterota bacterium]